MAKRSKELQKRDKLFAKQRATRGWDDSDTWCLDDTIIEFVLPRLKRFKQLNDGHPGMFKSMKEWNKVLSKMIRGFEIAQKGAYSMSDKERSEAQEGINLFSEHFFKLWW